MEPKVLRAMETTSRRLDSTMLLYALSPCRTRLLSSRRSVAESPLPFSFSPARTPLSICTANSTSCSGVRSA